MKSSFKAKNVELKVLYKVDKKHALLHQNG